MGRDRFDHSVDHKVESKPARLQRVEVITGVERRRKWSQDEKLAVVVESLAEGAALVSEVARLHGISPQQYPCDVRYCAADSTGSREKQRGRRRGAEPTAILSLKVAIAKRKEPTQSVALEPK